MVRTRRTEIICAIFTLLLVALEIHQVSGMGRIVDGIIPVDTHEFIIHIFVHIRIGVEREVDVIGGGLASHRTTSSVSWTPPGLSGPG